ncbi:MAG: acylphosphatase [Acidobacteriaceae bacterium]
MYCRTDFIFRGLRDSLSICDTALAVMVRHFIVKGRVQGVGFRWFVQREAFELGLRGWVRNTADGDVEVLAAANEEQLRKLRAALKRGSRGSRVDAIEERQRPDAEAEGLQAFEIEGAW